MHKNKGLQKTVREALIRTIDSLTYGTHTKLQYSDNTTPSKTLKNMVESLREAAPRKEQEAVNEHLETLRKMSESDQETLDVHNELHRLSKIFRSNNL